MAVSDAHVFPGFLTPVLTQLFFPKPLFSHASAEVRGENTLKRSRLNRESNSLPPGHESVTLTTEPPGWGVLDNKTLAQMKSICRQKQWSCLKPSPQNFHVKHIPQQALAFKCLLCRSLENMVGKGEIICNKPFLFFPTMFSANLKMSPANSWSSLKFVVWESV